MRKISTLYIGLPEVGGKACAQRVACLWAGRGRKSLLIHSAVAVLVSLWKTARDFPQLYTICVQTNAAIVDYFTSVSSWFYTVYTGPITTTTIFINRRIT